MREPPARRDQREIVVPGDMRVAGTPARSPRRRPVPRGPAPGGWKAAALAAAATAGRFCLRHPGGVLGSAAGAAAAIYVCVNAVGLQVGPHPAPILPSVEPKPLAMKAPATQRDVRAAEVSRPAAAPVREVSVPPRDPIAEMIRSGETTASVTPRADARRAEARRPEPKTAEVKPAGKPDAAKVDAPKPDQAVIRVQRALAKLGYGPLKDDGLMGPGTKAAIEKFERDRKLPVKGEAAGPTLRALTREVTAKAAVPQG
ncbi:peptidoglycan-binding domain-containing protein [Methylobacterium sp. B4]|uniref:peptidoglycan-binding domain-containing protein n=1 Tax=Methylobacterium sp. B4 TaxID=1938755 RepID=UPI000D7664EB|nr:peptidoglycan-binding domain-containing protein [Methylobacterium sp. B4]PXW65313.1 putative peptidoglycan binding protein [Methylobacterium sp. B4]